MLEAPAIPLRRSLVDVSVFFGSGESHSSEEKEEKKH